MAIPFRGDPSQDSNRIILPGTNPEVQMTRAARRGRPIDRRTLFRYGAAGGAAAAAARMLPAGFADSPAQRETPALPSPFELEEATIADLQKRMESGMETARSITTKYLARIDEIDR